MITLFLIATILVAIGAASARIDRVRAAHPPRDAGDELFWDAGWVVLVFAYVGWELSTSFHGHSLFHAGLVALLGALLILRLVGAGITIHAYRGRNQ